MESMGSGDCAAPDLEHCGHWKKKLDDEIECWKFWQFLFFKQWMALKQYCQKRDIQIMGDIPIFVAGDSADVWAHPAVVSPR